MTDVAKNFARTTLPLLITAAFGLAGCTQGSADTTKTTTETETKRMGSTSQSSTTTKVETAAGDTKAVTNTFVGTVTAFKPGKSIEVMTGDKETHSFDLDGKNQQVSIDPSISVGSKVRLVEEKGENDFHMITATIAPAA
jgi:hypothetical protein